MNDSSNSAGTADAGGGAGFDWSSLLGVLPGAVSAGTGLYDLFSKSPTSAQGSITAGAQAADPFGSQRAQYQPMLQQLMTNPGQLTPQGQAALQQGQKTIERSDAAKGYLNSGNILQELTQYGTQVAQQDYNNQFNQLAQLSGVNSGSPASAGQILAGRYNQRNAALANIGGGLASLTGQGQGQQGGGAGAGGAMGNLSNLYSLYSKMNGGNSPISNFTSSLKDYFGGGSSATTGGSEVGAGSGGGFDQWAATQPGMDAGSGIGAGETASTYDALGSDAGGYGGWGGAASDTGSFGTAGSEAASASAGEASAAGAGAEGGAAGAGASSGMAALGPFAALAAFAAWEPYAGVGATNQQDALKYVSANPQSSVKTLTDQIAALNKGFDPNNPVDLNSMPMGLAGSLTDLSNPYNAAAGWVKALGPEKVQDLLSQFQDAQRKYSLSEESALGGQTFKSYMGRN